MPPLVSVVIPVLRDLPALTALLDTLEPDPRVEIVVADGEGEPRLDDALRHRPHVLLIRAPAGRARQMNAGAAAATGTWLLFLHADSRLPPGWLEALAEASNRREVLGGWFRFGLDASAWQARVIEGGVALRVRIGGLPYGDQGIFVRRATFAAIGGYREIPLMEDVEFVGRLRRMGTMYEPPLTVITSARRWTRDGWFRRSARNLALVTLYGLGVPPDRLARWYG